jgi:phosphatidyl-myo-inositol alpha-mannosyltransferase
MNRPELVMSIYDDTGNPHYGGGGPVVIHQIATRLARDYDVTVYTGSYRGSGRSRVRDGVRYVFLPVGWAGPRGGQLLFLLVLPLVALIRRPAVWVESLTPPVSSSLLPLVARCPVVGFVQMLSGAYMSRRYKLPFVAIERRGLGLYRHFVVLTETDRQAVGEANPRASIALIPNGVDLPPLAEADYGRGEHILFLGRIDVRQKGLDLLLEALRPDSPLPLVIVGSGTSQEEAKLRELLPRDNADRVRLVGWVDEERKQQLLRDSAFVVIPSRFETFSITALEAISHGKPLVHFDLARWAWIGTESAIAVPPFDVGKLRAAICELTSDTALRAELGRRARALAADLSWDSIGERYRELVTGLAPGHNDNPPA